MHCSILSRNKLQHYFLKVLYLLKPFKSLHSYYSGNGVQEKLIDRSTKTNIVWSDRNADQLHGKTKSSWIKPTLNTLTQFSDSNLQPSPNISHPLSRETVRCQGIDSRTCTVATTRQSEYNKKKGKKKEAKRERAEKSENSQTAVGRGEQETVALRTETRQETSCCARTSTPTSSCLCPLSPCHLHT